MSNDTMPGLSRLDGKPEKSRWRFPTDEQSTRPVLVYHWCAEPVLEIEKTLHGL
jgi:hypothetical protein